MAGGTAIALYNDFDLVFLRRVGWPSIREKALSRHKTAVPCFSHRATARVVEDRSSGTLTVNLFSVKRIVPPAIDTA
jgi:hypothetical protein